MRFFRWLGSLPVADTINNSQWLFPVIESIHITGVAILIGAIAIVDFRLLGLTLRDRPVAQIGADLRLWTLAGIGILLTTGPLMLSAELEKRLWQSGLLVQNDLPAAGSGDSFHDPSPSDQIRRGRTAGGLPLTIISGTFRSRYT